MKVNDIFTTRGEIKKSKMRTWKITSISEEIVKYKNMYNNNREHDIELKTLQRYLETGQWLIIKPKLKRI